MKNDLEKLYDETCLDVDVRKHSKRLWTWSGSSLLNDQFVVYCFDGFFFMFYILVFWLFLCNYYPNKGHVSPSSSKKKTSPLQMYQINFVPDHST